MMKAFAYQSPATLAEAVSALGTEWGQADVLAGGTDLLNLMKDGLASPDTLVNIKDVKELGGVSVNNGDVTIGATATLAQIAAHSTIKKHLPALAAAAGVVATTQIRNVATLGGNLCQRPRDWYYRSGLQHAEKREENQYAAVFPVDGRDYVHPSTLAPVLIAYGAKVQINGPDGERSVAVENLFKTSSFGEGERETVLKPNEIIASVTVPVSGAVKSADYEVREREAHDWPCVQAAVAVTVENGKISKASVVLGHVSPVPRRAKEAEAALAGKELTMETAAAAGKAAAQGAQAKGKNAYKVPLIQVAVKRALLEAVGQAYWKEQS